MWISTYMFISLIIAIMVIGIVGLTLLFKRAFKMSGAAPVVIALVICLLGIPAVVFVGLSPKGATVIKEGEAKNYYVLGGDLSYTFSDGSTATQGKDVYGQTIFNDSEDTYVMERVVYGAGSPEEPILYRIKPHSMAFLEDFSVDYMMEEPPSTIETSSSASRIVRIQLRKLRDSDAEEYYFYDGELNDKVANGQGDLYDGEKLVYSGSWEDNEPTGLPPSTAPVVDGGDDLLEEMEEDSL